MFKFFKREKATESSTTQVEIKKKYKTESKNLVEKYLTADKEIKYLQDKYDDFILKSLEVEYEQYKQFVDTNYPNFKFPYGNESHIWMFSKIEHEKFNLSKKSDMTLYVYYSFYKGEFELKNISVAINGDIVDLKVPVFKEIISNYFLYWKVKEIEKSREKNKESFQKVINIIGKDVKRDALIDQILS